MANFTRRHYEFIANILQSVDVILGNFLPQDVASEAKEEIVEYFSKSLELDNERFNPDLFRKATN